MTLPTVRIEFPFMPPEELRGNARNAHWAVRHRKTKELREATAWRLLELGKLPRFKKAEIQYTAYYCGKAIDPDGLVMGMKACLDEMVQAQVVPDDGPGYVSILTPVYHRVAHRDDVRLVVELQEVADVLGRR